MVYRCHEKCNDCWDFDEDLDEAICYDCDFGYELDGENGCQECGNNCVGQIPVCGNGRVEGSETCDDGNLIRGDGCSSW